ncbi:MAG: hypothetical protein HRT61_21905 [Ekhidna sp.]|nr:hypothetical protein [Ekhidna sp.]
MGLFFFRIWKYARYKIRSVGAHGLHSPFLFDLYNEAFKPSANFRLPQIESIRKKLLQDTTLVDLYDLKSQRNYTRTIRSIAQTSVSKPKFSAFLNLLINYLKVDSAVETGTSLGINAMYMAGSDQLKTLTTVEASPVIAAIAKQQFSKLFQQKIQLKNGTIQEVFEGVIIREKPELCFIDADHRSQAVEYCIDIIVRHNPGIKCIVIHDIYWSEDMYESWNKIVSNDSFNLTIDIFQAGLIFPNIEMPKQHFTIRF